ncbi:acyl--CoA ligase [Opitutia bacterium ISCC 51]|nr:acyl--CoA ligase [Opitutae bacterium ISCC 51]QXD30139.1 acyl--CoA ligase [Opitutae bacterium ISCC 52]
MNFETFNDMLRRTAMRLPDKTFLHWIDKDRSLTYAETVADAEKVAGALWGLGIRKGDRVGIFAHNGLDYILAMFGAWRIGAISCHINVLQAEDVAYFAKNATPKVLIYTHDMFPIIDKNRADMPSIEHYLCMDGEQEGAKDWNAVVAAAGEAPEVEVSADDGAHLSYTSGSSGVPKGALLPHGAPTRASNCIAERLQITSADVTLGATSPASSYGLVVNWLPAIHRGAKVGLMSRWNIEKAYDHMESAGVTLFPANPLLFDELLQECRKRGSKPSALRACPSGGAPVPPELKQAFQDELGIFLVESYGQSELGGFVGLGYPKIETGEQFTAIGPPLPDKEVRIMDENDQEVPNGEPGEMCLRGGFMIGYWGMPEKTEEALRNGWLHTGDMGRMDDQGYVHMLGRWSERIVSNGTVIFPRAMEEALFSHPAVQFACVIGTADAAAGELPKAIVALNAGHSATEDELLAHAQSILGAEKSPVSCEIIDEMPMTPTGKIGRVQLQAREKELDG